MLTEHQQNEAGWKFRGLALVLHEWWDYLTGWGKLDIPRVALRIEENLRRTCLGYFRPGHNEFGLRGEIAIGVLEHQTKESGQTPVLDLGEMIGTLLHEQLHLYQALHGTPSRHNHHNKEFRRARRPTWSCRRLSWASGLRSERSIPGTPSHSGHSTPRLGVAPAGQPAAARKSSTARVRKTPPKAGKSTLRKWTCGCQKRAMALVEFHARCLKCGNAFVRV